MTTEIEKLGELWQNIQTENGDNILVCKRNIAIHLEIQVVGLTKIGSRACIPVCLRKFQFASDVRYNY
jgi:hypothetical protein